MLLIKNGTVHLPDNRAEAGWDILTEGDKISCLGPGLEAQGAQVIDASGLDVYPGLILALSAVGAVGFADGFAGWDKDEKSDPITPEANIRHAFDLRELKLQRFGRVGITSYGLSPGMTNLFSGQMAYIHVDGERTADVFIKEPVALKGNYIKQVKSLYGAKSKPPMTRMAMYQMMDAAFKAAKEYMEQAAERDADKRPAYDEKNEVLVRVLRKEMPFFVNAYSQNEIETMIELGEKYDIDLVLCGAFAIDKCAPKVIEKGWHVVLGDPTYFMLGLDNEIDLEAIVSFYRQGLKLSLGCSGDAGYPPGYEQLLWVAALMRRAGASGQEIMDMMTINPAAALGVGSLAGSLEEGKLADIILCRGNPALRYDNFVEHTIVAGRHFYAREGK